ncbi:MAG: YeeE/YedE family protein [Candidatus Thermoplasmatota archaeon]|nr:YeeE/YedE family protein [Candidatus Thermoplasmatota archaeon]MBS3789919.1 YeeE/YedE family protein [Candidatus Thermoplasmatota archaeon]
MLERLYEDRKKQLLFGFLIGVAFGFLLDRGGATDFDVIVKQLLLKDFTVLKIIFSAIITGMIGVHLIVRYLPAELQPKPCFWKPIMIGGLIFGAGFALLGLCPGTAAGALGTGSVHALFGVLGMLVGAGLFASIYPKLTGFIDRSNMGEVTIDGVLEINKWWIITLISLILAVIMYYLEMIGL